MNLSGDEAEPDVEAGEVTKTSMLRRGRQVSKQVEEDEAVPQMRRRKAGGGNNGAAWILMGFVVLVVLAWWGLMTAVMGSNKVEPHRVVPLKNAKQLIEATEGLQWDSIYAAHAKQIGWVLEDRGELLNIGFPDGTTKWYPANAVRTAVKGAERKRKHRKHTDDDEEAKDDSSAKGTGHEEKEGGDLHQAKHKRRRRHHFEDESDKKEEETPAPTLEGEGKGDADNAGDKADGDKKEEKAVMEEKEGGEETPAPTKNRRRRKHVKIDEGEGNEEHHAKEVHEDEGKEKVQEDTEGDTLRKHRRKRKHDDDGSGSEHMQEVHTEGAMDSDEHHAKEVHVKEQQEDSSTPPRKHKRRRRKRKHDDGDKESGSEHMQETHNEGEGEAKEVQGDSTKDSSSKEDTQEPSHKHKKKHGDEDTGSETGSKSDDAPKKKKKRHAKKKKSRGGDLLSLESNIPKHKETCTYPALHPHKWAEKFGWGQKKEFPPCDTEGPFSAIKFPEGGYERGSDVAVALKDETTLTFREQGGSVVYSNGVDITDAEVTKVGLKMDGGKNSIKVNKSTYRVDVDWGVLEKLRAMLSMYHVPCSIPRAATITFEGCSDGARVLGMHELPDSFFQKMQSTVDAEHRQNELKNLYTADKMEHTVHEAKDGAVTDLTEPYLVAVCGQRRALYLNLPSQGLKPKKENKKKLNVMHVMFDSTSLAALIRACPKIIATLEGLNNREDSPSKVFSFKHLHAVSCCSPGNQIPMYSGRMNGEGTPFVKAEPNQKSSNWIWNVASKLGYNTFFSLDNCPDKSSRDFQAWPSVDHRMVAPTCMAGVLLSHKERSCLTHRPIDEYIFEAADQFWQMYPTSPKYAAVQLITPHEETEKLLIELDDPMTSLLTQLEKKGHLNNTAVVFFSDHGINFGRYAATHDGEIEKMFPFMHVILPRWLDQDIISFEALRGNQDALVTPYDMHQLLREIVYYPDRAPPYEVDASDPPLPKPEQSHIVASMKTLKEFEKVGQRVLPPTRDCTAANIPQEFCTCIGWEEVSDKSTFDEHVAAAIKHHQQALEGLDQCMPVQLNSVTSIELQKWPTEYHPKEHPKAKKIWMAPNRDMLRIHYTLKDTSAQFEAILSLVKDQYSTYDVAIATRLDAMTKKCGVTEKKAEILCVCKED